MSQTKPTPPTTQNRMNSENNFLDQLPDRHFYTALLQNFAGLLLLSLAILAMKHNGVGAWSFFLGAAVSGINFWLLSHSIPKMVRADLAAAPSSRTQRIVRRALIEFLGRYLVVGVVAYFAIRSRSVHLMAFAMGLSLPIFSIMVQGIRITLTDYRVKSL